MSQVKRQVSNILDMWCMGYSLAKIAQVAGVTVDTVEYVINEYGTDVT